MYCPYRIGGLNHDTDWITTGTYHYTVGIQSCRDWVRFPDCITTCNRVYFNKQVEWTVSGTPHIVLQIRFACYHYQAHWCDPPLGLVQQMYEYILMDLDSRGPFHLQSVLVDYEAGIPIRNTVMNVWPETSLRSCWFHYKKALWRHLQMEGLAADYVVDDSPIRNSCLLIVDTVDMAWRFLKPTLPSDMMTFARYYEDTWIGTSTSSPLYDHHDATQMMLPTQFLLDFRYLLLLGFLSSDYEIFKASLEPYFDTRDISDLRNFIHSLLSGIKCTLFANLTTYYIAELAMNKISKIRYVSSVETRFQRCSENFIITASKP